MATKRKRKRGPVETFPQAVIFMVDYMELSDATFKSYYGTDKEISERIIRARQLSRQWLNQNAGRTYATS